MEAKLEIDIQTLNQINKEFEKEKKLAEDGSVIVGYTANYAVYVHEDLKAHHTNGQAKFLEQPARSLPLANIVRGVVKKGKSVMQGLLMAGLRLQRESQKLVPVDTGNLKNSAFTRKQQGKESINTPSRR